MLTRKLLSTWLALTVASVALAQTDVTAQYLLNPSFEADASGCTDAVRKSESSDGLRGWDVAAITGWTTTRPDKQLLITADCYTDNNFGKTAIADGTYALFQRNGWSNGQSTVSQTTTAALPAGSYELHFSYKAFYANSATSSVGVTARTASATLGSNSFAFMQGSAGCMASGSWSEHTLSFKVDEAAAVTFSLNIAWVSGGSQIAIDNVRLMAVAGNDDEPTITGGRETDVASPTEGVITHDFVAEADMMHDLLQMLTDHLVYAKSIYTPCVSPTSAGEECGYFRNTEGTGNDEQVVRPNADYSMVCAFLYKYAKGTTTLPDGITWDDVREWALKSLIWGYSSHRANSLKVTSRNAYWGSTSTSQYTWESSLWAMSLCYAAHFLHDELTSQQHTYIYNMVKAECNYELQRSIPTGYAGDTKAEENGWEADILACALGLYPNDALAPQWFDRLRAFAINSYSQADDANDATIIDPAYDQKTVADYYLGPNLYDDYTLQNHNLFHTSYQNVVMQELGEAHLAMQLFQGASPKWTTRALMHNQQEVMDQVLNLLALADGELAMPNGNDWSLFLFDQITSYSTAACFLRDANALLLENMAYKFIKARQQTTTDGSWLLRPDVGSRRMGVEAHRVMMTYLMHAAAPTSDMTPASWEDFARSYQDAHLFTSQNIVRASSDDRFATFSWSTGLKSYTGYFTDTTADRNKIVCPYRANNTGNIIGWYTVSGKGTNATPVVSGIYDLHDNAFTMNGSLSTNDGTLENRFVLAATRGNALIYLSNVKAQGTATITGRRAGMLAITTDPFTRPQRTLYHAAGRIQTDGTQMAHIASPWVCVDNSVGIVTKGGTGQMAFGEQANNNSILCSKLYPSYSADIQQVSAGDMVDSTTYIYYSNVDSTTTARLNGQAASLGAQLPEGWDGVTCADPDGSRYLLVANLSGGSTNRATLTGLTVDGLGGPVLRQETAIIDGTASATIALDEHHSLLQELTLFVSGGSVYATAFNRDDDSQAAIRVAGSTPQQITLSYVQHGTVVAQQQVSIGIDGTYIVSFHDGTLVSALEGEAQTLYDDVTTQYLSNPGFEDDATWGTTGSITLGSTTYNPCYTQSVAATDSRWPQVLPVEGWTAENTLTAASNFALLYSMPYSFTQYCVSPSNVGNSTSIMAAPAGRDDEVQTRCLSVLNSWTNGTNAISQTTHLPKGDYVLAMDMRYSCPNEGRRIGDNIVATTGGNTCSVLCGVSLGGNDLYTLPTAAESWQTRQIAFSIDDEEGADATFRLGMSTTASLGAAQQVRLYVDNLRLFRVKSTPVGIGHTAFSQMPSGHGNVYDLSGRPISGKAAQGICITQGRKLLVK